jgi:hypothetical protein
MDPDIRGVGGVKSLGSRNVFSLPLCTRGRSSSLSGGGDSTEIVRFPFLDVNRDAAKESTKGMFFGDSMARQCNVMVLMGCSGLKLGGKLGLLWTPGPTGPGPGVWGVLDGSVILPVRFMFSRAIIAE